MAETKTIFIVDDDEEDRLFIREALVDIFDDINVVEIPGGVEMGEWMEQCMPDQDVRVILMDMNMPRLNGLELLSLVKHNEDWKRVPVVMISTTSNPYLVNQAYNFGVNAFITKPSELKDFEMLAQTIGLFFLNTYPSSKPSQNEKLSIGSVVVIEDSDDQWLLTDFSLRRVVPGIQTKRLRGKADSLAFFNNEFKTLEITPDFILLDLYLPERKDGLELLDEIRETMSVSELSKVPVIVFSNSDAQDDVNASLFGQANAYLVKPSDGQQWTSYFEYLCNIMSHTISLPKIDCAQSWKAGGAR